MHAALFSCGRGNVSRSAVGIAVIRAIERVRHNFDSLQTASNVNKLVAADVAPSIPNRCGHHPVCGYIDAVA